MHRHSARRRTSSCGGSRSRAPYRASSPDCSWDSGASLAALAVAELLGVKDGLGWYIQWTKGWAAYPRMYAAIVIMMLLCRTLMLVLFRVRNHVLAYEKDLVRW